jgi:hypothetical protein
VSAVDLGRLAKPMDHDLVVDFIGLQVASVALHDTSFLISLTGGRGWRIRSDMARQDFKDASVTTTFDLADVDVPGLTCSELVDRYLQQLNWWAEGKTPLRLCAAPGKLTLLLSDPLTWLAFPDMPARGHRQPRVS